MTRGDLRNPLGNGNRSQPSLSRRWPYAGNGGSGVAFVLTTKLLHPGPKAMGVEFSNVVLVLCPDKILG